ncbi:MAG: hypothetical protein JWO37_2631 [Acidimicrobiales bacterium]|nr:hypothetical protein [Acidimicrobiales bacterium]
MEPDHPAAAVMAPVREQLLLDLVIRQKVDRLRDVLDELEVAARAA